MIKHYHHNACASHADFEPHLNNASQTEIEPQKTYASQLDHEAQEKSANHETQIRVTVHNFEPRSY
tara:strand:- start:215 stop:412 length:198 start_codon:yes stop_codon:yes gene_type:complete